MKKIFTYFGIFLSVVLMGILSSCTTKEIQQSADLGLNIKVFSPTKVVAGQPMTINGSGFGDVKEIIFPNAVSVTDFDIVSNEMIRVVAPSGISAEGGKLIVRTDKDQVESPLPITIGSTSISGYSKQEGEEVEGGSQLTIFGKDLEFIYAVELLNADGLPNIITHEDFYRKGTSSVVITIPKTDIYEGSFKGVVYTYDGKSFEMPEFAYKPKQGGGHWEIKKVMMWENGGTVTDPANWNGIYRYALEGHDGGKEAVAEIPQENWDIIKTGTFYLTISPAADWYQVRVVTGWWNAQWPEADSGGAFDFNTNSEEWIDNEDGTFTLPITFGNHEIVGLIDDQHLLFTGGGFIVENLYYEKEEWVEGGEGHWEHKVFWKNDGSKGAVDWGNVNYRFGLDGNDGGNECIATFPADVWSIIKDGTFRISFDCNESSNIRITTGWWSASYGGTEHNCMDMIQEEEDGTKYIEINIKEEGSLYDLIDQQHFLITGSGCTPLEIYVNEWVEGGDVDPEIDLKDHITYEQPNPDFSYPYYPSWSENTGKLRILRDRGLKDLGLQAGKSKFIFYKTAGTTGQIQINNPNWNQLTTVADWNGDVEILEYVLDEAAIKCVTGETVDGWSETAIILQGDGLEVTKMTVLP